jgi:hypothetical protein
VKQGFPSLGYFSGAERPTCGTIRAIVPVRLSSNAQDKQCSAQVPDSTRPILAFAGYEQMGAGCGLLAGHGPECLASGD